MKRCNVGLIHPDMYLFLTSATELAADPITLTLLNVQVYNLDALDHGLDIIY
jgi:hypothetical protein